MSRTLRDTIASDFGGAAVTAGLGQTITITTPSGVTYTPVAIMTVEKVRRRETDEGITMVFTRSATFSKALGADFNSATSIASSLRVTVDGLDYAVENIARQHGSHRLELYRAGTKESTRGKYRGGR